MSDQIDLRKEYTHLMGAELGNLYYDLQADLEKLRYRWREFQMLYQTNGADELLNVDSLNVAPDFFRLVHTLLYESAMLHLCRITDPPKRNLTVMRLPKSIPHQVLKASTDAAIQNAKNTCEFAKQWRDKTPAHTDLSTHKNGLADLPKVETKDIEAAINALSATLDLIKKHYGCRSLGSILDPFGAKSLMRHLEGSVRAEEGL